MPTTQELLAELARLTKENAELAQQPKSTHRGSKKVGSTIYAAPGTSGRALKPFSQMSEEEQNEVRARNLIRGAITDEGAAAWHTRQAAQKRQQAIELCPKFASMPDSEITSLGHAKERES